MNKTGLDLKLLGKQAEDNQQTFHAVVVRDLLKIIAAQDKEIERLKPVKGRHRHSQDGVGEE